MVFVWIDVMINIIDNERWLVECRFTSTETVGLLGTVTSTFTQLVSSAWNDGPTTGYWAIQRSWFARVNALCNLSAKKS